MVSSQEQSTGTQQPAHKRLQDQARRRSRSRDRMERVTFRIPKQHLEEVETLVDEGEFPNRSEAIRSALRTLLNDATDGQNNMAHASLD